MGGNSENIRPGQTVSERPDIVARVFMEKLKSLCKVLNRLLLPLRHSLEYVCYRVSDLFSSKLEKLICLRDVRAPRAWLG
ncbi:Helitron helicase-like protein [Phytophthora palmivora]|uniref:Helitron helicase-like protein n=1 Tax=Phytophthora palmivora TaxID=4796 RepID=A0A2P4X2X4_9STRA|nr:Helitron helicase-like protein [Phytophthora palmivora]